MNSMPMEAQPGAGAGAASAWREPMVWLVWAGPAAVVVASLITAVIAVRLGDRPLAEPPPAVRQGQADALTPALVARNHAQTLVARPAQAGARERAQPPAGR